MVLCRWPRWWALFCFRFWWSNLISRLRWLFWALFFVFLWSSGIVRTLKNSFPVKSPALIFLSEGKNSSRSYPQLSSPNAYLCPCRLVDVWKWRIFREEYPSKTFSSLWRKRFLERPWDPLSARCAVIYFCHERNIIQKCDIDSQEKKSYIDQRNIWR